MSSGSPRVLRKPDYRPSLNVAAVARGGSAVQLAEIIPIARNVLNKLRQLSLDERYRALQRAKGHGR